MNEMAAVIDRRDAEKMFPLIPVNQALLVKLKKKYVRYAKMQ